MPGNPQPEQAGGREDLRPNPVEVGGEQPEPKLPSWMPLLLGLFQSLFITFKKLPQCSSISF